MKRNGRPPFQPTGAQRRRCSILAAARMPQSDIALIFGITEPTLRKHFTTELTRGAAECNGQIIESLYEAASGGNVTAQKAWLARQASAEGSVEPMGKKDQREAAAKAPPPDEWEGLVAH